MSKINLSIYQTDWKLKGSSTGGLSIANARSKGGKLEIENANGTQHTLLFAGVGGGFGYSLSKGKFSLACSPMPRAGGIYRLPLAGKKLTLSELCGGFVMYEISGHALPGGNAYIMFLGGFLAHTIAGWASLIGTPMAYGAALVQASNAFICSAGMTVTSDFLPIDGGVSGYFGFIGTEKSIERELRGLPRYNRKY